jgi:hypothetical protein
MEAGDVASETGDYICDQCHVRVFVTKDETIPRCPKCGNHSYAQIDAEIDETQKVEGGTI